MKIKTRYVNIFDHQDIQEKVLNTCGIETQSISFTTRKGKWSMIDMLTGTTGDNITQSIVLFGLFEHDALGDLTDLVLAYFDWYSGDNVWKEIDGTYDDIYTALYDADMIEFIYQ